MRFPVHATLPMIDKPPLGPLAGTALPCYVFDSHEHLARHEVFAMSTVEGRSAAAWTYKMLEALVMRFPVKYANARSSEEYDAKNMIRDKRRVEPDRKTVAPEFRPEG